MLRPSEQLFHRTPPANPSGSPVSVIHRYTPLLNQLDSVVKKIDFNVTVQRQWYFHALLDEIIVAYRLFSTVILKSTIERGILGEQIFLIMN